MFEYLYISSCCNLPLITLINTSISYGKLKYIINGLFLFFYIFILYIYKKIIFKDLLEMISLIVIIFL